MLGEEGRTEREEEENRGRAGGRERARGESMGRGTERSMEGEREGGGRENLLLEGPGSEGRVEDRVKVHVNEIVEVLEVLAGHGVARAVRVRERVEERVH